MASSIFRQVLTDATAGTVVKPLLHSYLCRGGVAGGLRDHLQEGLQHQAF